MTNKPQEPVGDLEQPSVAADEAGAVRGGFLGRLIVTAPTVAKTPPVLARPAIDVPK